MLTSGVNKVSASPYVPKLAILDVNDPFADPEPTDTADFNGVYGSPWHRSESDLPQSTVQPLLRGAQFAGMTERKRDCGALGPVQPLQMHAPPINLQRLCSRVYSLCECQILL